MDALDGSIGFELSPGGFLAPFRAAVSRRTGGTSAPPYHTLNVGRTLPDDGARVHANEQRILGSLGLPDRVARVRLEHGARILRVSGPGLHGPADGLLTDRDDLVLWFTVADCVPVTVVAGPWRAHGHCGWRGTAAGLPARLVEAVCAASQAPPAQVRTWVGPGVGPCCYPVGPETAACFPPSSLRFGIGAGPSAAAMSGEGDGPSAVSASGEGAGVPRLDLHADILRQLSAAGVPEENVARSPLCTSCHPELFFSHRRDGSPSGRMAALCWPLALVAPPAPSPARPSSER